MAEKFSDRYSRHEMVAGAEAVHKLHESRIAIVGVGGLGSFCADLCARAGIGSILIVDFDKVSQDNLQRQVLFVEEDIGRPKVMAAKERLGKINSEIEIIDVDEKLAECNIHENLFQVDAVLDCTDNMEVRKAINRYCVDNQIPWIHGSAVMDKGEVIRFSQFNNKSYCYDCIHRKKSTRVDCRTMGVLSTIVGVVASLQTQLLFETLSDPSKEQVFCRFALNPLRTETISVSKAKDCPVCGKLL